MQDVGGRDSLYRPLLWRDTCLKWRESGILVPILFPLFGIEGDNEDLRLSHTA